MSEYRINGTFLIVAAAVAAGASVFVYEHKSGGAVTAMLTPEPAPPAASMADAVASGMGAAATEYFAPDNPLADTIDIKNLCGELRSTINGALESAGSSTAVTFTYDQQIQSYAPLGLMAYCTVSINGDEIYTIRKPSELDDLVEFNRLVTTIVTALPETDIRRLLPAVQGPPAP